MPPEVSPSPPPSHRYQRRGFSCDRAIKYFFASNAGLTAYFAEINGRCARELKRSREASAVFNSFSDQTSATRDLIVNNKDTGLDPNAEMLATLHKNHAIQKQKALASLPATPHLTAAEREQLIESIRTRDATATEDPLLVTTLAQEWRSCAPSSTRSRPQAPTCPPSSRT
ncbi:MAG: hypothetical protein NTV46_14165 [Verrucomicrobia bacterium]|nr:hypothetical protein [Verrucomicrobiota bacterium]